MIITDVDEALCQLTRERFPAGGLLTMRSVMLVMPEGFSVSEALSTDNAYISPGTHSTSNEPTLRLAISRGCSVDSDCRFSCFRAKMDGPIASTPTTPSPPCRVGSSLTQCATRVVALTRGST